VIINNYRGQPEKIAMYFDQSIITPSWHSKTIEPAPEPVQYFPWLE
jgi:hypothetical protein